MSDEKMSKPWFWSNARLFVAGSLFPQRVIIWIISVIFSLELIKSKKWND